MAAPRESEMEAFADQFAAKGDWALAISTAETVLREYEREAAGDPVGYAPLVERARARIARLTADAEAVGAPTKIQPSAFTLALIAAANPHPTAEDETVIARAKAEAAAAGMSDHVEASLAGIAAAREADPTDPSDPSGVDRRRARDLTDDLQRLIGRERRRARRVDGTTYEMEVTTATLPTDPDRNLARRFARQSALLRRYGRHTEAVAAAVEAVTHYAGRTDLDDTEQGYHAYSLVLLAEDLLARREVERAHDPAATAMRLFIAYRQRLVPGGIPDIVRAGLVLAQCQAHLGSTGAARQTLLDIAHLADELDATFRGPVGVPGAMPGGWGLPVVPSARDWKVLRKRLTKLSKQLWG